MVKIDSFIFGNIIIKGKTFTDDVVVSWDGEVSLKQKTHAFSKSEFQNILMKEPEIVIIGTGTAGLMKVDPSIEVAAKIEGVELMIRPTQQAIEDFNKYALRRKVIGVFHLTC
jgi:hypothetical protein